MNNSELSTVAPSADTVSQSNTSVFSFDWEATFDPSAPATVPLHNRDNGVGRTTQGTATAVAQNEAFRTEESSVEHSVVEPRRESSRSDSGRWLLQNSVERLSQWELIREFEPRVINAQLSGRYAASLGKRGFDVVGSLLLLIALFPLFVVTAILIKLDSVGPVFFRHDRVGREGRSFSLWKFRSMKADVPKYEVSPQSAEDVRLTRVGCLLRRWSIDELPQLINVLKGDMSLVGPRPEMPFLVAQYGPAELQRLAARPGITGLWQISPARAFPIHENLQYDLHYIRNQNFLLDCAILMQTMKAVIYGIGAV
jgi:lipopolysaccharide/colanic/teichoic acid biosynthesis glycosyltransferase